MKHPLKPLDVGTPIYYFNEDDLRIRKSTIHQTPERYDTEIAVNITGSYRNREYVPTDFVVLCNDKDLQTLIKHVAKHLCRVNKALQRNIIKNNKALDRLKLNKTVIVKMHEVCITNHLRHPNFNHK